MFSAVFTWLNTNLFTQTALFMGVIVAIGLIAQKKKGGEVVEGFMTTVLGYFVFSTGSGAIGGSAAILGELLKTTFNVTAGVNPGSSSLFTAMAYGVEYLAPRIIPCFVITWILHILIVKYVKAFKVVYMTVHNMLSLTSCLYIFFYGVMGYSGIILDLCAGVFMLLYITVSPMLTYKVCMEVTGGTYSLGWFNQFGGWIASKVAPLCGDPEKDNAENLKLPGWLKNLADHGMSVAIALPIAYITVWILVVIVGNADALALLDANAKGVNSLIYMFLASVQFAGATYILIYGLRMYLGALLPAFQGIADKFLPDAVPGIDSVAFYSLSPNAVVVGMISYMIASVITSVCLIAFKSPVIVMFNLTAAFFEMCAVGVIANRKGGWKACVITGIIEGCLATAFAAFFASGLGILDQGIAQCNIDSNLYPAVVSYIFRLFK